jgi:hypothetical protein
MRIKSQFVLLAALVLGSSAFGDEFQAGYVFTYHFDTLPLTASGQQIALPGSYFYLALPFGLTSTISYELFSGLPIGTPVSSGIWMPGNPSFPAYAGIPPTWQDFEGSFRVTVLSGSQQIDSANVYLRVDTPNGFDIYTLAVTTPPVPEPASSSLITLASVVAAGWFWRTRRKGSVYTHTSPRA